MAVYFIQAGEGGPVKIGCAANVKKRIKELQCGCPEVIKLLREVEGNRSEEAWFHARFAKFRVRKNGEWFRFHEDMMTEVFVDTPVVVLRKEPKNQYAKFIDDLGGASFVSTALGISHSVVCNWRNRGVSWMHRTQLVQMAKKSRVAVPADFLLPPKKRAA